MDACKRIQFAAQLPNKLSTMYSVVGSLVQVDKVSQVYALQQPVQINGLAIVICAGCWRNFTRFLPSFRAESNNLEYITKINCRIMYWCIFNARRKFYYHYYQPSKTTVTCTHLSFFRCCKCSTRQTQPPFASTQSNTCLNANEQDRSTVYRLHIKLVGVGGVESPCEPGALDVTVYARGSPNACSGLVIIPSHMTVAMECSVLIGYLAGGRFRYSDAYGDGHCTRNNKCFARCY